MHPLTPARFGCCLAAHLGALVILALEALVVPLGRRFQIRWADSRWTAPADHPDPSRFAAVGCLVGPADSLDFPGLADLAALVVAARVISQPGFC